MSASDESGVFAAGETSDGLRVAGGGSAEFLQRLRQGQAEDTVTVRLASGETIAVRPHPGAPAVYWAHGPDGLIITQDIAQAAGVVTRNLLSRAFFVQSLTGTAGESVLTPYSGVFRLPPGNAALWSPNGTTPTLLRVWEPPTVDKSLARVPIEELGTELWRRIRLATRIADAYACELSGGLDSSAVVAAAAQHYGAGMPAFSWKPVESSLVDYAETAYVDSLVSLTEVDVRYVDTHVHASDISGLNRYQPYPLGNHAGLRLEAMQRAMDSGVTVLLSGHGGDQVASFRSNGQLADALRHPDGPRLRAAAASLRASPASQRRSLVRSSLLGPVRAAHREKAQTAFILNLLFDGAEDLLGPATAHYESYGDLERDRRESLGSGLVSRRTEIDRWLGQQFDIQYQYPLLSREVLDWCLSIPAHRWFEAGRDRAVFREALRGNVPDLIRLRQHKQAPPRGDREVIPRQPQVFPASPLMSELMPGFDGTAHEALHPRAQGLLKMTSQFLAQGQFDGWGD